MKLIATLIATTLISTAFAADKVEPIAKPVESAAPATPKAMPKVKKPEPLNNKAKSESTPTKSEAAKPAKKDKTNATTQTAK